MPNAKKVPKHYATGLEGSICKGWELVGRVTNRNLARIPKWDLLLVSRKKIDGV